MTYSFSRRCHASRSVATLVVFGLSIATVTMGQEQAVDRTLSERLSLDLHSLISTRSLTILGIAGATAAWSWEESDENFDALQRSLDGGILDVPADIGNVYGGGWVVGGSSLGLIVTGSLTDHERMRTLGSDLCRAYLYSGLTTGMIKHAVGRKRPSGGPLSFPSGHTTSAFSTIPVIWHHLGWPSGVAAGVLASMTAVGRMEENRHYLSDVIAGAAIGYVVGSAVASQRGPSTRSPQLTVTSRHVGLAWSF